MKLIDLTGKRVNHLTVIGIDKSDGKTVRWLCRCDCGNIKSINGASLRSGTAKDCGCSRSEIARKNFTKHGGSYSRIHGVWREMRDRCRNPKHKNYIFYGGRGIKVCEEWDYFANFRNWAYNAGYDEHLESKKQTIDRINVDGDYCPENCRIVDMKAQSNNRRNNVFLEYKGERHTASEWARIIGIKEKTLHCRIERGWSIERAIETYPRKKQKLHKV